MTNQDVKKIKICIDYQKKRIDWEIDDDDGWETIREKAKKW